MVYFFNFYFSYNKVDFIIFIFINSQKSFSVVIIFAFSFSASSKILFMSSLYNYNDLETLYLSKYVSYKFLTY